MNEIHRQQRTVEMMIRMYCHGNRHGDRRTLCPECRELLDYARRRLDRCPFGDRKGSCRKCTVHCYAPAMAERIRQVMRYSGPRMLLRHPVAAIRHLISEL